MCYKTSRAGRWWCSSIIPALLRQGQVDLCEFEVRLIYREGSWTAKATQRNPVLKITTKPKNQTESKSNQVKTKSPNFQKALFVRTGMVSLFHPGYSGPLWNRFALFWSQMVQWQIFGSPRWLIWNFPILTKGFLWCKTHPLDLRAVPSCWELKSC